VYRTNALTETPVVLRRNAHPADDHRLWALVAEAILR
jgi:hypothetical protein